MKSPTVSNSTFRLLQKLLSALFIAFFPGAASAAPPHIQSGTKTITPSRQQVQHLSLDLQMTALRCEQKLKVVTQEVFDSIISFRIRQKRFPESSAELHESSSKRAPKRPSTPANPFADPSLVSRELRQELINSGNPATEFCKIILESDPYISAGFPLSLKNVKLKPDRGEPGSIVAKYNGTDYLAVWCMGLSGQPLLDEKTQLPFVLFKDFSILGQ